MSLHYSDLKYRLPTNQTEKGFTLIELMIVVAIIGILSAIAIPLIEGYFERANVAETVCDLRNFENAFKTVATESDDYPNDSHIILPPGYGVEKYIMPSHWLGQTPVGGNYNWEGPDAYPYAGIAILGATAPLHVMEILDLKLDDGNLATGRFRLTPNGRHTYILRE